LADGQPDAWPVLGSALEDAPRLVEVVACVERDPTRSPSQHHFSFRNTSEIGCSITSRIAGGRRIMCGYGHYGAPVRARDERHARTFFLEFLGFDDARLLIAPKPLVGR
jgi:hypothetical protein